jgi:hypothetical protein
VTVATAGQVYGNLRLVAPVDLDRLTGTVSGVLAQYPLAGPQPWLTECTGCGRKIVTTPSWCRRGFTQCDSWSEPCRTLARRPGYPSADEAEAELAPQQSAVWTAKIFPARDDLWGRLAAMRARVAR